MACRDVVVATGELLANKAKDSERESAKPKRRRSSSSKTTKEVERIPLEGQGYAFVKQRSAILSLHS